jgi:hypothetical protein
VEHLAELLSDDHKILMVHRENSLGFLSWKTKMVAPVTSRRPLFAEHLDENAFGPLAV